MSNYADAKKEIGTLIKARMPFIVIQSSEREKVEKMLSELAKENACVIDYYTAAKQLVSLGSARSTTTDIGGDPLRYGFGQFKRAKNNILAIGDINYIDSDNAYSREFLNLLYLARESCSSVIVVTADSIWQRLSVLGMIVKLDFPNQEEIAMIIRKFIADYQHRFTIEWTDADIEHLSILLKGFSEVQLENVLSEELIDHNGLFKDNINNMVKRKDKLFGVNNAVQPIKVQGNINVAGMDALKDWLKEKKDLFFSGEKLLEQYDLKAPKGILLVGVPGCGKSFCAKMIAKEWGVPLYKFDIGSLFDKWMGESERKMRESLQFIDNVSPCILWIDEIEKELSTSDSSNDTGNRMLGQFLFWLQESSSRVFLVATANNINKLPAELFRKGRFSEIFFVGLPGKTEREEVISIYSERALHKRFAPHELSHLADITKGYSYSDIETAIKDAAQELLLHPDTEMTVEKVSQKIAKIVPITKNSPEIVNRCLEWGKEKAINVSSKEAD